MSSSLVDRSAPLVVRVSGPRSNVGKTTLIELLIPQLAQRGLRVGTIKHTHHGFDLDHPGKDSHRHRRAGAAATVLIGPTDAAILLNDQPRMMLEDAVARLVDHVDVVLAEGFRASSGLAIHLDPDQPQRISSNGESIIVGVSPDELTTDELEQLIDACIAQGTPA